MDSSGDVAANDYQPKPAGDYDGDYAIHSLTEWMAVTVLLADRGHCEVAVADDDESQTFAAEVRRRNRDWAPGTTPLMPVYTITTSEMRSTIANTNASVHRGRSREQRPQTRRGANTSSRNGPRLGDDEPEPPLARPLGFQERLGLRRLIDQAVRAGLPTGWRECPRCLREQEPEEFGRSASYCRSCESARVSAANRRRRQAVAA